MLKYVVMAKPSVLFAFSALTLFGGRKGIRPPPEHRLNWLKTCKKSVFECTLPVYTLPVVKFCESWRRHFAFSAIAFPVSCFFVLRDRQLHFTEQYVGPSHYLKGSKVKVNKSLFIFTMKVVQSQLQIKI